MALGRRPLFFCEINTMPRRDNTSSKSIRRRFHCNASGVVLNVSLVLGSLRCRTSGFGRSATNSRPGSRRSVSGIRNRRHPANHDPKPSVVSGRSEAAKLTSFPKKAHLFTHQPPIDTPAHNNPIQRATTEAAIPSEMLNQNK